MRGFLSFLEGGAGRVGVTFDGKTVSALPYQDMGEAIREGFSEGGCGEAVSLDDIAFLPPVVPGKLMCLGWNYAEHIEEMTGKKPDHPMLFYKPSSSLTGHLTDIILPPPDITSEVHNEAELAVVIGRKGKGISKEDALDHVAGYTVMQDITARDLQDEAKRKNQQWEMAKSFDTFAPMGPWIVPAEDIGNPQNLHISLTVNGKVRQDSNTHHMVFSIAETIAYLSRAMTLYPGDVISTGTPQGVGAIEAGDVLEAQIEGIGILKNTVVQG